MPILLVVVVLAGVYLLSKKEAPASTGVPPEPIVTVQSPREPGISQSMADAKVVAGIVRDMSSEARGWITSFNTNEGGQSGTP